MRYARTLLATFVAALAAATAAPVEAAGGATQAIVFDDGSCIVLYDPDVIVI